jgi:hypothetical protein
LADRSLRGHQVEGSSTPHPTGNPDKSAMAEHSINQGHAFYSIMPPSSTSARYMDRIVREAIEVELHPFSKSKENGFCLSVDYGRIFTSSLKLPGHNPVFT